MGLLFQIIVAVLVAALLAFIIVKFVPLKMRWLFSIILLAASIFLGVKIYQGIMAPIKFDIEKKKRYTKVIDNLKLLRDAQIKYGEVYGGYTKNKNSLISFIENGKLAITETKNITVKENRGGGITVDVSKRKVDTIGFEPVLKHFKGKDYKGMFTVPGSNKEFIIETNTLEKIPGLRVPVFLIKTDKASILKGMDASLVKQELEALTTDEIKGANITVGSLEEVSTGGNWPPFYDKPSASNNK